MLCLSVGLSVPKMYISNISTFYCKCQTIPELIASQACLSGKQILANAKKGLIIFLFSAPCSNLISSCEIPDHNEIVLILT